MLYSKNMIYFKFKKILFYLAILIFTSNTLADESNTEIDISDNSFQESLFYIGLGKSDNSELLSEEPWSVGIVIRDEESFLGFDIGGEGIMIERSRNYDNTYSVISTDQATSFNFLAGLKVAEQPKFRLDLGILAGVIEQSSECPSSYGSYQCYYSSAYDSRTDYEYTFNYGLVLNATFQRTTFGIRATGESTQLLFGINF